MSFTDKLNHGQEWLPPEADLPDKTLLKLAPVASQPADPSFLKRRPLLRWKQCAKALAGISLGAVLLTGCEPDDVPRFSPDGKKVALLLGLDLESYHQGPIPISVVTLADGRLRHYPLPEGWWPRGFIWIEQRLLISAARPTNGPVEAGVRRMSDDQDESRYLLLDTKTGRFSKARILTPVLQTPFLGTHQRRRCLYAQDWEEEKDKHAPLKWRTTIVSASDLSAVGSLPFEVEGVGEGWMIRPVHEAPDDKLLRIEILDPEAKKVSQIQSEEFPTDPSSHVGPSPACGKISRDHARLLLAFSADGLFRRATYEYEFAVYDVHSGKRLWMGRSNSLRGVPVVTKGAVYALEAKTRDVVPTGAGASSQSNAPPPEVMLVRHGEEGRTVMLELPLQQGDLVGRYSHSPNCDRFLLLVEGQRPRLLLIPVRDHFDPKKIVSVPLVVKPPKGR